MAFSTLVSFLAGISFLRWTETRHRKVILIVPITIDLFLLGFFKYTDFMLANWNILASVAGLPGMPLLNIVLPIGISFYTFHTITYIVDCYRGTIVPTRNLFEFSCYVSLFAQLVAGPIVRFREIEHDLNNLEIADRREGFNKGCSFIVIGLAKKVLLADSLAAIINPALDQHTNLSTAGVWMCILGYTYQLYFDFSGYSDMAIGLGHLFGIRLPQNFNSPYRALDISDFWRRWHMSLSRVLRDYLYIPLGGSRKTRLLAYRNLMITMLLGGLWHGASWTFVCWGAYHGILLCLQKAFSSGVESTHRILRQTLTFLAVIVGWALFRSNNLQMAGVLLRRMFWIQDGVLPVAASTLVCLLMLSAVLAHLGPNAFELNHTWQTGPAFALCAIIVVCVAAIYSGHQSPFLYFQF
jgi:alginate O-acetyltransferase complex protein AlgI